ncbi:hypothetical protein [Paenibacillus agricola]|uniref:Uncharacterized protein n=1 Tax=Paenibacillus agricola TaxID=2716264 RepID=A0ABX0JMS0_9BACL|nr:hypothetical protein [Paenibacillus agricola]NHN35535.1 hypothetical protein [Paenibacillus agricola]
MFLSGLFLTVDRFLRKRLKQHRHCIRILQKLGKAEGEEEFPPICAYAYAYIFWRHTLIRSERFFKDPKANDIISKCSSNFAVVTNLIQSILESYRRELFSQINKKEVDELLLHWIMNRLTIQICINYFKQWLQIATKRVEQKTVPNWNAVDEMVVKSISEMAFKHSVDMELKQPVEFYINPEYKNLDLTCINLMCPLKRNNRKKRSKRMSSYMPLHVAMKVIDNPSTSNKKLAAYVDQYVR